MRRFFLLFLVLLAGLAPSRVWADPFEDSQAAKENQGPPALVAVFRLTGALSETPTDESFPLMAEQTTALKDLVRRMQKARDDKEVKAVAITLGDFSPGLAQMEELRQAIAQLRAAGKDVYAHADSLSFLDYTLLSGATQLSVVPTGDLWVTGIAGQSLHVRKLLDMIGAQPDFLTCGAYKSAAELFMRDSPSQEADEMHNWLFDGLYESCVRQIARGRGASPQQVRRWIDEGPYSAEKARAAGLIDAVQHRQEFEASLKQRFDGHVKFDTKYGKTSGPKLDFSSPFGIINFYAE
jgi:protease-4